MDLLENKDVLDRLTQRREKPIDFLSPLSSPPNCYPLGKPMWIQIQKREGGRLGQIEGTEIKLPNVIVISIALSSKHKHQFFLTIKGKGDLDWIEWSEGHGLPIRRSEEDGRMEMTARRKASSFFFISIFSSFLQHLPFFVLPIEGEYFVRELHLNVHHLAWDFAKFTWIKV